MKKKAFTLIELLIVIAVIAILFIVLLSKVNFASDRAKDSGVLTDFRSYQIGVQQTLRESAIDPSISIEDFSSKMNKNLDKKMRFTLTDTEYRSNITNPYGYHYVLKKDGTDIKIYSINNQGTSDILDASNVKVFAAGEFSKGKVMVVDLDDAVKPNILPFGDNISVEYQTGTEITGPGGNTEEPPAPPAVPDGWVGVYTADDLNNVRNDLGGKYILMNDIDLNVAPYNTGSGWQPIGSEAVPFAGEFDGNGKTIKNLYISRAEMCVGLFSSISSPAAKVQNLTLTNVDVYGTAFVGALVGYSCNTSLISNCGVIDGYIRGGYYLGGLVGENNAESKIQQCHTDNLIITPSGSKTHIGGLVAYNINSAVITDCYSSSNVTGNQKTGGLVGYNVGGIVKNSYSVGAVTKTGSFPSDVGGAIGCKSGVSNIQSVYYNRDTSLLPDYNTTLAYTAEMKQKATFVGWNFDSIWQIDEGSSYPTLRN